MAMEYWTKEDINKRPRHERPSIRCRYQGITREGSIIPDGSGVWIVVSDRRTGKCLREFKVSWGLLLTVLNDPKESPINID